MRFYSESPDPEVQSSLEELRHATLYGTDFEAIQQMDEEFEEMCNIRHQRANEGVMSAAEVEVTPVQEASEFPQFDGVPASR